MRILLARHGETPWNAEGRYQGQVDIPLSDVGIAQATALGERLKSLRIDRAVASPLSRATRTAQLALGEARAPMLTFDEGFLEIGHGDWEGLTTAEIEAKDPQRLLEWRKAPDVVQMPGPGGECIQQVQDRAWPALVRACEGLDEQQTLLVVAHDAVNRVLLCKLLGMSLARMWTYRQAPATLNLLEGPSVEALEVVRLNDCAHHTAFFGEAKHRAL